MTSIAERVAERAITPDADAPGWLHFHHADGAEMIPLLAAELADVASELYP